MNSMMQVFSSTFRFVLSIYYIQNYFCSFLVLVFFNFLQLDYIPVLLTLSYCIFIAFVAIIWGIVKCIEKALIIVGLKLGFLWNKRAWKDVLIRTLHKFKVLKNKNAQYAESITCDEKELIF